VDYVFVPEGSVDAFVAHCQRAAQERVPDINGPDVTSIIDQQAYDRLMFSLKDAQRQGATVLNLLPDQTPDPAQRKIAPHLVLNPTSEMLLMQREIFGPILPIKTYQHPQEVVDYINSQDRPLAIYPFTHDKDLQHFYISHVMSGGVSVNEALLHVAQHDLPFGGVGASGMGHYHAQEGFNTFSKLRPIFYQGPFSGIQMLFLPPYQGRALTLMNWLIKLKG
jgi:coniferyl-aldehyde dehydrogenase